MFDLEQERNAERPRTPPVNVKTRVNFSAVTFNRNQHSLPILQIFQIFQTRDNTLPIFPLGDLIFTELRSGVSRAQHHTDCLRDWDKNWDRDMDEWVVWFYTEPLTLLVHRIWTEAVKNGL